MMKLLLGGSPCTHWSIAQTKNRETQPSGIGWELFENYLVALEKFKPDYFLYENNKSMAPAIRAQITRELGVEPILINSALVSAQNRQRLYWTNIPGVEQPEDRGILLRDIVLCADDIPTCFWYSCPMQMTDGKTEIAAYIEARWLDIMRRVYSLDSKAPTLHTCGGGHRHPKVLQNGRARRLTVTECKRLQTVPDDYVFPVSDTQAYKMLGNGWTVDVIAHILSYCPGITTEPLEVLSMYDGMSCGHLALAKLGANIARYYATEIDKYAIKTTLHNFPDTIQLGDAFQVRADGWSIPEG